MRYEDLKVGMAVVYRPHPTAPAEDGIVTELRPVGAMVRYADQHPDAHAKLTRPADLEPALPLLDHPSQNEN